jgi:hypothetical protein
MNLTITEQDFSEALTTLDIERITTSDSVTVLGSEEERQAVIDAMPKVIAKRIQKMLPDGFRIREIEMRFEISGTPFGVGVSGEATVRFGPSRERE